MSSQPEQNGPRIQVTRHDVGFSVKIKDQNPSRRYLPVDPREFKRAVSESAPPPKKAR